MDEALTWKKSSLSGATSSCVEVASDFQNVWIRDSKSRANPPFRVSLRSWNSFKHYLSEQ
ncbi:DUF397 domain-containing protein [Streptomyces avermitilis]|uniref:DUF397 domain-containing protein n=1 Tax=Streptomyces avermitilis TaxID=33903 RepID=UPI0033A46D3F